MTSTAVSALSQSLFAQCLGGLLYWPRPLDIVEVEILTTVSWKSRGSFFPLQKSFKLKFKRLFVELFCSCRSKQDSPVWRARLGKDFWFVHVAIIFTILVLNWCKWFIFKNSLLWKQKKRGGWKSEGKETQNCCPVWRMYFGTLKS